jgi:hypothetical protein
MPDEADPPRKFYGLKPRDFGRANDLPSAPLAEPPKPDPGITVAPSESIDVRELIRAKAGDKSPLGSNTVKNRKNEVHDMLRDNLAKADAAGLNEVKPRRRMSRRKRDYWITMAIANAILIAGRVVSPLFGAVGLIMFNLCYTWLTWFVLEDY